MVIRRKPKAPKIGTAVARKAKGLQKAQEQWVRTTVMIKQFQHGKLKSIAYWEKKGIKEIIDNALTFYLKGKKIKPLPKRK